MSALTATLGGSETIAHQLPGNREICIEAHWLHPELLITSWWSALPLQKLVPTYLLNIKPIMGLYVESESNFSVLVQQIRAENCATPGYVLGFHLIEYATFKLSCTVHLTSRKLVVLQIIQCLQIRLMKHSSKHLAYEKLIESAFKIQKRLKYYTYCFT